MWPGTTSATSLATFSAWATGLTVSPACPDGKGTPSCRGQTSTTWTASVWPRAGLDIRDFPDVHVLFDYGGQDSRLTPRICVLTKEVAREESTSPCHHWQGSCRRHSPGRASEYHPPCP